MRKAYWSLGVGYWFGERGVWEGGIGICTDLKRCDGGLERRKKGRTLM